MARPPLRQRVEKPKPIPTREIRWQHGTVILPGVRKDKKLNVLCLL